MYKCNICVYNASLLQNSQYKADDMYYTFDANKRTKFEFIASLRHSKDIN